MNKIVHLQSYFKAPKERRNVIPSHSYSLFHPTFTFQILNIDELYINTIERIIPSPQKSHLTHNAFYNVN